MNWRELVNFAVLSDERVNSLIRQHGLDDRHVNGYAQIDPSPHGKYMPWLLKHNSAILTGDKDTSWNNVINMNRDLSTYHNNLSKFPIEHRDINKHTPESLHEFVKPYHSEKKLDEYHLPEGAEVEHESGPYHFVKATHPDAVNKLCNGSAWCIGKQQTPKETTSRLDKGPIHIIYKDKNRYGAAHLASREVVNNGNSPFDKHQFHDLMQHWPQGREALK
jgi:hypothetical protein